MVKPSPALYGRLRFTTKQVGRGFYRGNRTGSLGAHTEYGQYLIDWRKTKHFNVPDTTGFTLSPFITQEMEQTTRAIEGPNGDYYTPAKVSGLEYLWSWRRINSNEYIKVADHQQEESRVREEEKANARRASEVPAQLEDPVQHHISTQSTEGGQSPFHQQQARQMHTSSRRLISSQENASGDPESSSPTKGWLDMTRAQIKAIVNKATTTKVRQLKKEGIQVTSQEKKTIKYETKLHARNELIGKGIFRDQLQYERIMVSEGRRRAKQGLPRATLKEREEFLRTIAENPRKVENIEERIQTLLDAAEKRRAIEGDERPAKQQGILMQRAEKRRQAEGGEHPFKKEN